jgi:hypothetical protein
MKKVFLSSNDNPLYIQFWPIAATAWKNYGFDPVLSLVTDRKHKDWKWMEEFGEVDRFNLRPELPAGNWAKVARFFSYYKYDNLKGMVGDIDMLPLNKDYFDNLFTYDKDKLVLSSFDAYEGMGFRGEYPYYKFPGCYMVATGKTWKNIINPQDLTEHELIKSFYNLKVYKESGTYKEGINYPYEQFSEESLIRVLVYRWDNQFKNIVKLKRPGGWSSSGAVTRIDRSKWSFDESKLREGYYLDAHCLRPLQNFKTQINPITEYLNIPRELIDLGIKKSQEIFR